MFTGEPWLRWPPAARLRPEERVAGLHQRHEGRRIGLRAGVRLHVGEARVEQLLDAVEREVLGDVDVLAAAVVAPAGQALGVFVGHHRALRLEHGAADDVLGGDQLDLVALAAELQADRLGDLRVGVGKRGGKEDSATPFAELSGTDIGFSRDAVAYHIVRNAPRVGRSPRTARKMLRERRFWQGRHGQASGAWLWAGVWACFIGPLCH